MDFQMMAFILQSSMLYAIPSGSPSLHFSSSLTVPTRLPPSCLSLRLPRSICTRVLTPPLQNIGFTRSTALDYNITINVITPAAIRTAIIEGFDEKV